MKSTGKRNKLKQLDAIRLYNWIDGRKAEVMDNDDVSMVKKASSDLGIQLTLANFQIMRTKCGLVKRKVAKKDEWVPKKKKEDVVVEGESRGGGAIRLPVAIYSRLDAIIKNQEAILAALLPAPMASRIGSATESASLSNGEAQDHI